MKYLLLALTPFLFATKGFSKPIESQELKPLTIGTTSGYAPFVSLNAEGDYEGFDIDIAKEIATKLNRKLVIKDLGTMPNLMLGLRQGKIDLLIWAVSITEERLQNMEMVYYQGEKVTELPFLFWKEIPEGIQTFADLGKDPKKMLCIETGTFQEAVLKKLSTASLKYMDKVTDLIMEIKYGKSFGTTIDPSLVATFTAQYPELKVLKLPLPPESQALGNGICINKGNPELAKEVKDVVEGLRKSGKIAALEKKWGVE